MKVKLVKLIEHNDDSQMRWGGNDDTRKYLKIGKIYKVKKKEIHSWHTRIYLEEFPDKYFNSVCFEEL